MKVCLRENVRVNKRLLKTVEKFYQTYRRYVKDKEDGKTAPHQVHVDFVNGLEKWEQFHEYYKVWLMRVNHNLTDNQLDQYKTIKDVKDEEYNRTIKN